MIPGFFSAFDFDIKLRYPLILKANDQVANALRLLQLYDSSSPMSGQAKTIGIASPGLTNKTINPDTSHKTFPVSFKTSSNSTAHQLSAEIPNPTVIKSKCKIDECTTCLHPKIFSANRNFGTGGTNDFCSIIREFASNLNSLG